MLKILFRNRVLVGILIIGALLRFLGLRHGFPYIFHPDEPTVVRSALGLRFYPNPGHFDWPHLYIYLNYFVYMIFAKFRDLAVAVGSKDFLSGVFPLMWNDDLIFYLLTRSFSAFLGTLTIIPVYLTGKELFGKKAGLWAGFAFAIMPFHVWHSHYSVIDVPMVFFFSWAVYFSSRILRTDKIRPYILSGLFVGFAASTKYHGALSALVLVLAFLGKYVIIKKDPRPFLDNLYKPFLAGVCSLVGFVAGTPYALLDWSTFSRTDGPKGAFWQFTNVGSVTFGEQFSQFIEIFFDKFVMDWGPAFVILFFLSCTYFIYLCVFKNLAKEELVSLLLIFVSGLIYIFYISGFSKNRSHYYLISYPFVAIAIGWMTAEFTRVVDNNLFKILLSVFFLISLLFSIKNTVKFMRKDTRQLMSLWIRNRKIDPKYNIYYNGEGFEQVLPSEASKLSEEEIPLQPYILFEECEGDIRPGSTPFGIDFVINDTLRRGPDVCIYTSYYE